MAFEVAGELESCGADVDGNVRQPGDVSPRAGKAFHESAANGIVDAAHDNGNRRRHFLRGGGGDGAERDDDVDAHLNQLCGEVA